MADQSSTDLTARPTPTTFYFPPSEPSTAGHVRAVWEGSAMRNRLTTFIAVHPSLQRVLQWMHLYNPGGSMNP